MTIAETIIQQMGGLRSLQIKAGAKVYANKEADAIEIVVPRQSKGLCKMVKIAYDYGMDLYNVTGYRVTRTGKREYEALTEVYAEELQGLFEKLTGYFIGKLNVNGHIF